jgi:hypothetical protein
MTSAAAALFSASSRHPQWPPTHLEDRAHDGDGHENPLAKVRAHNAAQPEQAPLFGGYGDERHERIENSTRCEAD